LNGVAVEVCNAVEDCARTVGGPVGGGAGGLSFDIGPRQIFTLRVRPYVIER
jgi:hypothetical protein